MKFGPIFGRIAFTGIEKRDYNGALDKLRAPNDYAVFHALQAEVFWLRGNILKSRGDFL